MLTRQWLIAALAGLLAAHTVTAQGVTLKEAPLKDACLRNEVTMELEGEQSVKQDDKAAKYPLKVQASHIYVERYLDVTGFVADKAARFYTQAERTVRFNSDAPTRVALRAERSFMAAQRIKEQLVSFSPKGMLTREEIELTDHFDTMAVAGLLPGTEVAVGKSWTIPNQVAIALCDLAGLTKQNLEAKFDAVKGTVAHVTFVGNVAGIDMGAEVSMIVNGKLEFDTKLKRIVFVEWVQEDERKQGPISPAMKAKATIHLRRTPIAEPSDLSNIALVPIPNAETPPSYMTNIHHADPARRFELQYPRDWHVVSPDNSAQLVMRLMERGDFITQVTVSPWKKIDVKNVMTKEQFAAAMAQTPGWRQEKEIECKEMPSRDRYITYRVAASGELDGIATWQYFYLVVGPQGHQAIVTFSMIPQHVQRLGARDLELVRELIFPESSKAP